VRAPEPETLDSATFQLNLPWYAHRTSRTMSSGSGVDGRTLRGSACGAVQGRHLLAALDHTHGVVLGQVDVQVKTNEIPLFSTLLARIELTDTIVTVDAILAQRAHGEYLVEQRHAHYVLTVKRNQPHLYAQLKALPWQQIPTRHGTRERGQGREEWRTLKVIAATRHHARRPERPLRTIKNC
jgi:predicted transposase YbfD/YdcC